MLVDSWVDSSSAHGVDIERCWLLPLSSYPVGLILPPWSSLSSVLQEE